MHTTCTYSSLVSKSGDVYDVHRVIQFFDVFNISYSSVYGKKNCLTCLILQYYYDCTVLHVLTAVLYQILEMCTTCTQLSRLLMLLIFHIILFMARKTVLTCLLLQYSVLYVMIVMYCAVQCTGIHASLTRNTLQIVICGGKSYRMFPNLK